jgi:hypothetical protein
MILLSLIPFVVNAQDKYVPKAKEESYGTWVNEKGSLQKTVIFAGGFMNYILMADKVPTYNEGESKIEAKWIDSEGNVWYKSFGTITEGMGEGQKFQTLARVSKSGTVYERVTVIVDEFDPNKYLTEINPNSGPNYCYFTRSEN